MSDEEKKDWEKMVGEVKKRMLMDMQMTRASYIQDRVTLAADAELKRLREAVEWACGRLRSDYFRSIGAFEVFQAELRRRAKEGG